MQSHTVKNYMIKGFGFKKAHMITDEGDILNGLSLVLFNKALLHIVLSNTKWVDDNGVDYNFALDSGVLYIQRVAIGFKL